MHRVSVQYGPPADPVAFDSHYREVHVPLVRAVPGLRRLTLSHPRTLGEGPVVHLVAEMWFDDAAAAKAGLKSPEMAAAAADSQDFEVEGSTTLSGGVEDVLA